MGFIGILLRSLMDLLGFLHGVCWDSMEDQQWGNGIPKAGSTKVKWRTELKGPIHNDLSNNPF